MFGDHSHLVLSGNSPLTSDNIRGAAVPSEPQKDRKLELLENRFTRPSRNCQIRNGHDGCTSDSRQSPRIDDLEVHSSFPFDPPTLSYQSISQASDSLQIKSSNVTGPTNHHWSIQPAGSVDLRPPLFDSDEFVVTDANNTSSVGCAPHEGSFRGGFHLELSQNSNPTLLTTHTHKKTQSTVVQETPPDFNTLHPKRQQLLPEADSESMQGRKCTDLILQNRSNKSNPWSTKRKSVPVKCEMPSVKENIDTEIRLQNMEATPRARHFNALSVSSSKKDSKRKCLDFDPRANSPDSFHVNDRAFLDGDVKNKLIPHPGNDSELSPMKQRKQQNLSVRSDNVSLVPGTAVAHSSDAWSKNAKFSNRQRGNTASNNTSLYDFFPMATKSDALGNGKFDDKDTIRRQEKILLSMVSKKFPHASSLDPKQGQASVDESTSHLNSLRAEIEVLKGRCSELERSCLDKDEQLKAIANNRTILHAALKSKVQQLEGELSDLQNEKESRDFTTRAVIEKLVRNEADQQARDLRAKLAADGARLGKIVYTRAGGMIGRFSHVENWEDGHATKEIQVKRATLASKRQALESRQEFTQRELKRLKKNRSAQADAIPNICDKSDDPNEITTGESKIRTFLDLLEAEESARIHLSSIIKQEEDLTVEEQRLNDEKGAYVRALKRAANEDSSRFRSRPKLHDRYVLQELLGKGGFSEVWRAYDLVAFREVAVKIHQLDPRWPEAKKENYTKHVSREYEIHRNVRHPRIVSLYDVFEIDNNSFATVLECCNGADLDTLLKARHRLPEREARSILMQIIAGMQYLSQPSSDGNRQGIIHYDLKPGNILFDEYGDAKITDFGLSKIVDTPDTTDSMELTSQGAGTYWYLPPECFLTTDSIRISNKVDVWSIGVIFYQMLFGKRPFGDDLSQAKIMANHTMLNAQEVCFPDTPEVTIECKQFISMCLTYDQRYRPTITQLTENPYIMSHN